MQQDQPTSVDETLNNIFTFIEDLPRGELSDEFRAILAKYSAKKLPDRK